MSKRSERTNGAVFELDVHAVLFDLDGTLVDSTAAVVRSWLTWAAEYDIDPDDLRGNHGRPSSEIVAGLLGPERAAAALARIYQLELADTDGVVALPGAQSALRSVPADRSAIVTSCDRLLAAARISAADLVAPPTVITADDVRRGKPEPEPYLRGAQALGVPPERCLAVEDAPSGIASARAAGMRTIGVCTNDGPGADPADLADADLVVPDLTALTWTETANGVRITRL